MDFDPAPKILRNKKEMDEYLERYNARLSLNVKVEWCPPKLIIQRPLRLVAYTSILRYWPLG